MLGQPIAHSLSPTLHRAGYEALGLAWSYDAYEVGAGGLGGFLTGLDDTWRGLSLTMPLKREAMTLLDEVDAAGELAGAVNTVVLVDGRVSGANTDVPGAVAAVREVTDAAFTRAVVLGGGATASSTGLALCDLGVRDIDVLVRDPARATETLEVIERHPSGPRVGVGMLEDADRLRADIVVSTVPAQAQTAAVLARCAEVPVVFDVLYHPWPTPLAQAAMGDGRVLVGGLDLLVHQAVLQFQLFTGRDVPVAVLRAAGEAALATRGVE